jgi:hypothetical protein
MFTSLTFLKEGLIKRRVPDGASDSWAAIFPFVSMSPWGLVYSNEIVEGWERGKVGHNIKGSQYT